MLDKEELIQLGPTPKLVNLIFSQADELVCEKNEKGQWRLYVKLTIGFFQDKVEGRATSKDFKQAVWLATLNALDNLPKDSI